MNQIMTGAAVVLIFISMLLSPQEVFDGAADGLLLWFQIIIPTLFPFMLISNLLIESGGIRLTARVTGRFFTRIFGTSPYGSYAVLTGFLCGYPMGAKAAADLVKRKKISPEEGRYLLSFCNNTSPVFIMNFIVWKTFGQQELLVPTLLILMGVPVLLSFAFRRFYLTTGSVFEASDEPDNPNSPAGKTAGLRIFDKCMMDGFEGVVKVGGYIIFFSILIAIFRKAAGSLPVFLAAAPLLEVTNGILLIHEKVADPITAYAFTVGLTAFGGLCSVAQTDCMVQGSGLSILPYTIQKLTAAVAASLIAYLYMQIK